MDNAISQDVRRRLEEVQKLETWARGLSAAMKAPNAIASDVERFLKVTNVPDAPFDFEIEFVGRRIRAHYSWFTHNTAGKIEGAGRYSFFAYKSHPSMLDELKDEALLILDFGLDGKIVLGEDHLQFHPNVPEYNDERRAILMVYIAEALLKDSLE